MKSKTIVSLIAGVAAACCAMTLLADSAAFDFAKLKGRPNLEQTPLGSSGRWSLEKLLALTKQEGLQLWRASPAVPVKEMNGHYMGLIPSADDPEAQKSFAKTTFNENTAYGYWLGKAFKPVTENTGEGYNRHRFPGGTIVRAGRMGTRIGPSLVDGKPAYLLEYSVFDKKITFVDELRKLDDFIYVGIGTGAAGNGKRTEPIFFILVGPTDEWVGPNKE